MNFCFLSEKQNRNSTSNEKENSLVRLKEKLRNTSRFSPFSWRKSRSSSPKVSSACPRLEKIYERSSKIPTVVKSPNPGRASRIESVQASPKITQKSSEVKTNQKSFLPTFSVISKSNNKDFSNTRKIYQNEKPSTSQVNRSHFQTASKNQSPSKFPKPADVHRSGGSSHPRTFTVSSSKSSSSSSSSKSASSGDSITTVIPARRMTLMKNSSWLLSRFKGKAAAV